MAMPRELQDMYEHFRKERGIHEESYRNMAWPDSAPKDKTMDVANTVFIYKCDNGYVVEVRQGNHNGRLVGRMVGTDDMTPGKLIDAVLVSQRMGVSEADTTAKVAPKPKVTTSKPALPTIAELGEMLSKA